MHVLDRDLELHGDERAHPRRVEHARHADDALARELRQTEQRLRHRVERVGHRNDDGVRTVLHEVRRDALHDLEVVAHEIVAAHARLARLARRDHDDVGAGRGTPVRAADEARVRSDDRTRLVDIERHPCGLLLGDVDDDDIGQLLLRDRSSHRHADVAGATDHCHFAIHAFLVSLARLRSLSRSRASKYSQFLLKSLLKTTPSDHDRRR